MLLCYPPARSVRITSSLEPRQPPAWHTDSYWRVAEPSHAPIAPEWWTSFNDEALNGFEQQALAQNQTLAAASAHYAQARATLANNKAQQVPEVDLGANGSRFRISQNRPLTNYATPTQSTVQNNIQLGPTINYDTDLFGRIRREVEGATASAEQSRDDLANARLVLTHGPGERLLFDARTRCRDRRAEPLSRPATEGAGLRDH